MNKELEEISVGICVRLTSINFGALFWAAAV